MEFVTWREWSLSRLMLGTVQFGLPYGVANRVGQPTEATVRKIVELAVAGGVNCFDTAAAYGTSEEVLGRVLRDLGVLDQILVVTKVKPVPEGSVAERRKAIEDSVTQSRQHLGLDSLPLVLFHREQDAASWDILRELHERGWVRHLGVSCDNIPGPALRFLELAEIAALQVPANLVDHRHWRSGLFPRASSREVALFLRSVYLQGLLLMPEEQIPEPLGEILEPRRRLATVANEAGMSLAELAVRYLLSLAGATCVLVGVESPEQIASNLTWFGRGPLPPDALQAVAAIDLSLAELTITPRLWPPRV